MNPRRPRIARHGFTVMETLIAVGLLLALGGVIFGFLLDMLRTRDAVLEHTAQRRAASVFVEQLESDLFTAMVGSDALGSGIAGNESRLELLTSSVAAGRAASPGTQREAFSELIRAEYRFNETRHQLEVRRSVVDRRPRSVLPNDASRNARNSGDGNGQRWETLEARLYRIEFRYHDGREWRTSFDALDAGRFPHAVEVAIWFQPWPDRDWNDPDDFEDWDDPDAEGNDAPERLTFDPTGTFDEFEFAMREDRDQTARDPPRPDVHRVIVLPDAIVDSDSGEEGPR